MTQPINDPRFHEALAEQGYMIVDGVVTAMPKRFSKEQTHYTDDHGTSNEQCSKCEYYINPTTCEIVVGKINPNGWCNKFERAD